MLIILNSIESKPNQKLQRIQSFATFNQILTKFYVVRNYEYFEI